MKEKCRHLVPRVSVLLPLVGRWLALVLVCVLVACSSDAGPEALTPSRPFAAADSEYGIKIIVGTAGNERMVSIPPVGVISAPKAATPAGATEQKQSWATSAPRKPLGVVETDAGVQEFDMTDLDEKNNPDGWALLAGAMAECGERQVAPRSPWKKPSPSTDQPFFLFSGWPDDCGVTHQAQQTLICAASLLQQIADATSTLHWENAGASMTGKLQGPWKIPIQKASDKFIVRDVAIFTLAHVVWLDTLTFQDPTNAGQQKTCTDLLASAASNPALWEVSNILVLGCALGEICPPPEDLLVNSADTIRRFAEVRLALRAHTLRQTGRMLKTLIEDSVLADMAGAEQRRATAGDPALGAARYWGLGTEASPSGTRSEPYNSLAHAIRVVSGRWEMGPFGYGEFGGPDPMCGTFSELELLTKAYGNDFSARYGSREVTTQAQEKAIQAIEEAGIVVPLSEIESTTFETVRERLLDQMIWRQAVRNGLAGNDTGFRTTGQGAAIEAAFKKTADADLRFALRHALDTYRLATASPENVSNLRTSLTERAHAPDAEVTDHFKAQNWAVFDKGLPRKAVTADVMARAAGIQEASQCHHTEEGYLIPDGPGGAVRLAFQDSFALAQSIQRRLVRLRDRAASASPSLVGPEDAATVANAAVAELSSWAGPGRIIGFRPEWSLDGGTFKLYTLGFAPKDWAAQEPRTMADEIVLVYGEPAIADCVAKLRSACPTEEALAQHVAYPVEKLVVSASDPVPGTTVPWREVAAVDGTVGTFVFNRNPVFSSMPDIELYPHAPLDKHVYVVQLHDPDAPNARGKVLGSLALQPEDKASVFVVSDLQRKMLNDLLGVSGGWGNESPKIGKSGPGVGSAYCLGNPRDMFVPLESELTSDSDQYENSWKHFIALAREAAQRADDLGQKLIEQGLQQDYRREAAQEELAAVCGSYGALDDVTVVDGIVTPKPTTSDQSLTSCLAEVKTNVVFLTEDQSLKKKTTQEQQTFLRDEVLKCGTSTAGPCGLATIKSGGLDLALSKTTTDSTRSCTDVLKVMESLGAATGFDGALVDQLSVAPWLGKSETRAIAQSLRLEVTEDGKEWIVLFGGERIMDSRLDQGQTEQDAGADAGVGKMTLWPGCMRAGFASSCDWANNERAKIFNATFNQNGTLELDDAAVLLLRWRVEGALWMVASLGGVIPAGMFSVPIPAANFAAFSTDDTAHAASVYGTSQFYWDPSTSSYRLYGETSDDDQVVGGAKAFPKTVFYPPGTDEVPDWIKAIYQANHDQSSGDPKWLAVRAQSAETDLQVPADFAVSAAVAQLGGQLKGLQCGGSYSGPGTGGTESDAAKAVDSLGALRWERNAQNSPVLGICRRPKPSVEGFPYHLWLAPGGDVSFTDVARGEPGPPPQCHWAGCGNPADLIPLFPWGIDSKLAAPYLGMSKSGLNAAAVRSNQIADQYCLNTEGWCYRYARRILLPLSCPPADRAKVFVNSYPPPGACGAAAQLAQAMTLACVLGNNALMPAPTELPRIQSLADLPYFSRWIQAQADRAGMMVSRLYLEDLPDRVVADMKAGKVGTAGINGEHGRTVLQMGSSLRAIADSWGKIQGDLTQLRLIVDSAQNEIAAADIRQNEKLKEYAIRKMSIHSMMIQAVASTFQRFFSSSTSGFLGVVNFTLESYKTSETLDSGRDQLNAIDDLEVLGGQEKANQIVQVFIHMQQAAQPYYQDVQASLLNLQSAVASTLELTSQLRQAEAKAKYQAAKGMGEDYTKIDGKIVEYPVNTVLRREYDITRRRYQRALADAKYLAFVARLAIEQRIGMRLNSITTPVGPLEAPATWADHVCELQGIDYSKLRSFLDQDAGLAAPDASTEEATLNNLADQYVGDYVTKLENFVEYYNIQYPSHDGDDTVVLSFKDDLLGRSNACLSTSPNLLLYSGDLTQNDTVDDNGTPFVRGWQRSGCDDNPDRCLRLFPAEALPIPEAGTSVSNLPPQGQTGGGVTWLRETPAAWGPGSDAGVDASYQPQDAEASSVKAAPRRSVFQTVRLSAGSYLLSWWDQARAADGEVFQGATPPTLQVGAYSEAWDVIDVQGYAPYAPACDAGTCDSPWSAVRQQMAFNIASDGVVRIAFTASRPSEDAGSVLIANVQLEKVQAPNASPGPYIGNGATRQYLSSQCTGGTAEDVQGAFSYKCETETGCFYELAQPIVLDTGVVPGQGSSANAKFAKGNFNFRHITVSVNLVGTGLHDCTGAGTASCYGSGFIEYTLSHDAYNAGILGWDNRVQRFNFGSGSINHGKALSAERYITMPLSSADLGLLAQPGIEKPELRGRPIDGSYRLRIWDTPGLVWNRLEDVQLILKYRYWSTIQKEQGSK